MNCLLGETKASPSATTSTNSSQVNNRINSLNIGQTIGHTTTSSSSSTLNSSSSSSSTQETCLICGDVASGKHYGLRSCEACKAFFKRTVQGKIEYSCPANRECEINKRRRKACQACRFQKCLNMGMLKEGVRLDRVRGGRQKYRRGLSPVPGSNGAGGGGLIGGGGGNNGGAGVSGGSSGSINHLQHNNNSNHHNYHHNQQQSQQHQGSEAQPSNLLNNVGVTCESNRIMTALINCEPEELTASPTQFVTTLPSTLSVQMKTLYILSDLFDRELVSLIGWAKQIPGFSETITLNDQMRLLQSTWAEVIALSIGYRSHLKRLENYKQQQYGNNGFMNTSPSPTSSSPASTASSYNNNCSLNNNNSTISFSSSPATSSSYNLDTEIRLVFAKDLIIDFKHAVACGADEIFYNCVQLIKRLDYLKITPKEYIILKAISLTNADVRLENPKATHQLRDLMMDTLYEATLGDAAGNQSSSSLAANIIGGQKDNNNGINSISCNSNHNLHHVQPKIEAQDRPLSSMNQYASTSPPRPSSSVPSSSSLSSVSSNINTSGINNSNNMSSNNNTTSISIDSSNIVINDSKKIIINHRLNQVLLCLPVLRQIDSCIRKFWNDVRKGPNNVPMNKLFEEMLEPCQRIYKSSAEM